MKQFITLKGTENATFKRTVQIFDFTLTILGALILIFILSSYRYYNSSIYTVDTNYLKWKSQLPAFTVCPLISRTSVEKALKHSPSFSLNKKMTNFISKIFTSTQNVVCPQCWNEVKKIDRDSSQLRSLLLPAVCEEWFDKCKFNDQPFNCCEHLVRSFKDVCFSLNMYPDTSYSIKSSQSINFLVDHLSPKAMLEINGTSSFYFLVHDAKSFDFLAQKTTNMLLIPAGAQGHIIYKFSEAVATDSAAELTIDQRNCILNEELPPKWLCNSICQAKQQEKICGCHHHLFYGENKKCSLAEMKCLYDNYNKTMDSLDECECRNHCNEKDIEYIFYSVKKRKYENYKASVTATLSKIPSERYLLSAKTTFIETLVSTACLSRLFTSSSIFKIFKNYFFRVVHIKNLIFKN